MAVKKNLRCPERLGGAGRSGVVKRFSVMGYWVEEEECSGVSVTVGLIRSDENEHRTSNAQHRTNGTVIFGVDSDTCKCKFTYVSIQDDG